MADKKQEKFGKIIKGVVVSDKMEKTLVVAVDSFKTHPKYLKKYKSTKKYKVHTDDDKYKVGDIVEFVNAKPMSKGKKFRVIESKK
ncbi:MAG TPA: 30S ribosomal protein S17 [Candidatus Moranbacteria bacterium]|nr:30S ribosomal protein S17 [Candidatus Moranbacteria bacterium]